MITTQNKLLSIEECKAATASYNPTINYQIVLESILIHKNLISEDTE